MINNPCKNCFLFLLVFILLRNVTIVTYGHTDRQTDRHTEFVESWGAYAPKKGYFKIRSRQSPKFLATGFFIAKSPVSVFPRMPYPGRINLINKRLHPFPLSNHSGVYRFMVLHWYWGSGGLRLWNIKTQNWRSSGRRSGGRLLAMT